MIEVCSLDFLKKKEFEMEVMAEDGRVLCSAHDEVTPELILKLYFKKIYVDEAALEKKSSSQASEVSAGAEDMVAHISDAEETAAKVALGPRSVEFVEKEGGDVNGKSPRSVEFGTDEIEGSKTNSSLNVQNAGGSAEAVKIVVDDVLIVEDPSLEFDEAQAKRIVEHSLSMGKMFNYSQAELKELELVAFYCNYGVTEFKKSDMLKKEFRKMKAVASRQKLQKEEIVPPKIAEMIKFTATEYKSSGFAFGENIPFDHIVGITSYYEDMVIQGKPKEEILLKMLQLGGNQFNIFVLHKFIRMIRETNG